MRVGTLLAKIRLNYSFSHFVAVRNALGTALHIAILLFFTAVAERDVTKKFKRERSRSRRVTRP